MKIKNNLKIQYQNISKKITTKMNEADNNTQSSNCIRPSANNLKAYTFCGLQAKTGLANMEITPDYDSSDLICSIKSSNPLVQNVKFKYNVPILDEETHENVNSHREAFAMGRNPKTGAFEVKIPVLDRKNNTIFKNLQMDAIEYLDATNLKIDEEIPENYKIKPNELLVLKEPRTTVIDGEITNAPFDAISEGVSIGKLAEIEYEDLKRYKGEEPVIAILSNADMNSLFADINDGCFSLPMNVKGVITAPKYYKQGGGLVDCLGHAVSRLRGRKTFTLVDASILENIKNRYLNNADYPYLEIKQGADKMEVKGLEKLPKVDTTPISVEKNVFVDKLLTCEDEEFSPESVGLKAYNLGVLTHNQQKGGFKVPKFFVFPAGVWDEVKKSPDNIDTYGTSTPNIEQIGGYHFCVRKANMSDSPMNELKGIRRLIVEDIVLPKDIRTMIKEKAEEVFGISDLNQLGEHRCLIARSSFNGEDSSKRPTMGLYDSIPGIRTTEHLFRAIKEVEASKWSDLAFMDRRNHGIDHGDIQGNVIVQEVVPVDYTFTLYTADPRSNDRNKMVIQLSQGVYSCFPNSPYIFTYDKTTKEITRTALATKKRMKPIEKVIMDDVNNLKYDNVNYSNDPFNMSKEQYTPILRKVFNVAQNIEDIFGCPQDIEGGVIFKNNEETGLLDNDTHIWQSRDAHLIER